MSLRNATTEDIGEVVTIHLQAFPGFFLSKLGAGFLGELYRGFLNHPDGVFIVSTNLQGELTGFAAGTLSPERFFSDLRRRRGLFFLFQALPSLLRSPSLVFVKLFAAIFYRGGASSTIQGGCLLSSIGVSPAVQGQAVGRELLSGFEDEVFSRATPFVYLTTDKIGNDRVNAFYRRSGYVVQLEYMQGGSRPMLRYLKHAPGREGSST
jgi:ribosomal protein S18 acetylase RimI-like enzyme